MKKSYLISWIGAIGTFVLSLIVSNKIAEKYGQSVRKKHHLTFNKAMNYTEQGMTFILSKIK